MFILALVIFQDVSKQELPLPEIDCVLVIFFLPVYRNVLTGQE